ncbi:hypothetical protein ZIOFF_015885 [Zingiber officinale]|uniref:Metalloenzyme domain-containing protein n=1 Tax=Zingiber officinale TaxID=94328 RepID=A0A8J5HJG7_ZINOF|nr:hypothetical protein ZIOFF_015885 [Zingiber officinale]
MSMDKTAKRSVAFILIDGLGDVSLPQLKYMTPLQVANAPNLDAIASAGVNGLMDPVEAGLGCGSDTAHLSLLGYDPRIYYQGRGAFESMGAGLAMSPGDIAFKSNFATLDKESGIVTSRRADRHFEEEGPILCAALDGMKLSSFPEYEVRVRYATEHRCGVVVKGPKLSGNISGTDPLKDNRLLLKVEALDDTEEAKNTAAVVNELSKEMSKILVAHPVNAKRLAEGKNIANVVLLRGCGIRIEVPPFEKQHGLSPCMATAIAKALSVPLQTPPFIFVPGEDEHRPGRAQGYDFGFLHIKAIDDAGHDKASILKVKALEAVDRAIGQLTRLLWQAEKTSNFQYYLCVTGDHSTPVEYGDHSFEPVPFALCQLRDFVRSVGESNISNVSLEPFPLPSVNAGEDLTDIIKESQEVNKDLKAFNGHSVCQFSEIAAARGCLGRFPGSEMMGVIKKFIKMKNEYLFQLTAKIFSPYCSEIASGAVAIKMNVLLYAPPLFLLMLKALDIKGVFSTLFGAALVQIILGLPFLLTYPVEYLSRAFNLGRVFIHFWFLSVSVEIVLGSYILITSLLISSSFQDRFVSKEFSISLLVLHLMLLATFAQFRWSNCNIYEIVKVDMHWLERRALYSLEDVASVMFTWNFIGIVCARSLHYQFYSWYFYSLPFLLWISPFPTPLRLILLAGVELCWNIYPSNVYSSCLLLCVHLFILLGLWIAPVECEYATLKPSERKKEE